MGVSDEKSAVVVGAGMGGLAAAIDLACRGYRVTLLERHAQVGGKMRSTPSEHGRVDSGPTVLTMRWVFEDLFRDAGADLATDVPMHQANVLARHAWADGSQLDLFSDVQQSSRAIAAFAGAREAEGYRAYVAYCRTIYGHVLAPFMQAPKPHFGTLVRHYKHRLFGALRGIDAFRCMRASLHTYFRDPRLVQMFGRYATYAGGSPFAAPATLNVIAHVEQQGVWYVTGGMQSLADKLLFVAAQHGVRVRCNAPVERFVTRGSRVRGVVLQGGETLHADAVVFNGEPLAAEALVTQRDPNPPRDAALSAITWTGSAVTEGFALQRHNVFFASDAKEEFTSIFTHKRLPGDPTLYLCAQDRHGDAPAHAATPERLLCLINAPATPQAPSPDEVATCQQILEKRLATNGLTLRWQTPPQVTPPATFAAMFPHSQGALYGPAPHTWRAFFNRGSSRTRWPGLYLTGGSVHPGPGVPMAALSGRLAAAAVAEDCPLTTRLRTTVMRGGTSTPKATTAATP